MNLKELAKENKEAAKVIPEEHKKINELLKLPPYYGFVETPHNFMMFLGGNDDGVALRFLHKQRFEEMTIPIWKALVPTAELVLDIGAHTGTYSLLTSTINNKADIYAFEPFLPNFSRLLLNLRVNKINRVLAIPAAASSEEGYFNFVIDSSLWYLSSGGHIGDKGRNNIPVRATTVDSYVKKKVDLIKMDTEGHEPRVIWGASNTIRRDLPTIMLECNNNAEIEPTESFLRELGYSFFAIDDEALKVEPVTTVRGRGSEFQRNFFAVAREDHYKIVESFE